MSCLETEGGSSSCLDVRVTCENIYFHGDRLYCAERKSQVWDRVLSRYWDQLHLVAEAFDNANNMANEPAIWVQIEAEQQTWLTFRDASCAVELSAEYLVSSKEENLAYCRADLTRTRVGQIFARIKWMQDYLSERKRINP